MEVKVIKLLNHLESWSGSDQGQIRELAFFFPSWAKFGAHHSRTILAEFGFIVVLFNQDE